MLIGNITPKVAGYLGLKRNVLVVLGGHDHLCGSYEKMTGINSDIEGLLKILA